MRHILYIVAVILVHFGLSQVLPYWNLALVCFVLAYFFKLRPLTAFWFSLVSIMLTWGGYMVYSDGINDGILSTRMAGMFGLQSKWLVMLIASFSGGLLGGFSGASGAAFRRMFTPQKEEISENTMDLDDMDDLRPEYKGTKHV